MIHDYPTVERPMAQALAADGIQRELAREYGPTPQEQREHEARVKALAFETGDHQPDGTVRHTRASIDVSNPCQGLMVAQQSCQGAGVGINAAAYAAKLLGKPIEEVLERAASNANVPSPAVQRAISQMEQGFERQKLVDMQVLVMQFALHMSDEDRARIEANPQGLQRVIEQMQREMACELEYEYGINVEFAA